MLKQIFASKRLRKKLAVFLSFYLLFYWVFLPISYAQESAQSENQTAQQQSSSDSPTPPSSDTSAQSNQTTNQQNQPTDQQPNKQPSQPPTNETPTPAISPASEIQTGDAQTRAQSDTTVNYNQTTTQESITTQGCNAEVDLNCNPSAANQAETSGQTAATSVSGSNEITSSEGGAIISTGQSDSQATSQNLINTNIIEATGPADLQNPPTDQTVKLANSAEHQASSSAQSISGQNSASQNGGDTTIQTGDSISQTDQVNIINTNIIGSNFDFFLLPLVGEQTGDIDLNQLWNKLREKTFDASAFLSADSYLSIITSNQATVDLFAKSTAVSGQNQAINNASDATIKTGDSIASANIFNLINTNIIGSNFLFGAINIFGHLTGNIIVPSKERFLEYVLNTYSDSSVNIISNNSAKITADVAATADSGSNQQEDEQNQSLKTGESIAKASITNFANLNLFLTGWYFLLLNNFGFWDGTVDSWDNPAGKIIQDQQSATYQISQNGIDGMVEDQSQIGNINTNHSDTSISNKNVVEVLANINAQAISGQNKSAGNKNSFISTGRSIALANLFNFLNTNIIGSNFFMPIINLFGRWTGNLIFAYPNLEVVLSTDRQTINYGETLNYTLQYTNTGFEQARNVTLNISLPAEASLQGVSGPAYTNSGNQLKFYLGNIGPKVGGKISFSVNIQKPLTQNNQKNILEQILSFIVKPALAAESLKELITSANIQTPDPQSDTSKNTASITTYLVISGSSVQQDPSTLNQQSQDSPSTLSPDLEVISSNNTGEYVHPGDIITFFATVKNKGLGKAKDTVVYQNILKDNLVVSINKFNLGYIPGGTQKKLTFSIQIPNQAPEGNYQSIISAKALSELGDIYLSNDSSSFFTVKSRLSAAIPVVQAKEGEVLAAVIKRGEDTNKKDNKTYFLYALIFALAILWYVEYIRRRNAEESLQALLNKIKKKF